MMTPTSPSGPPTVPNLGHAMRAVFAVYNLADETFLALHQMKTPKAAFEESQAAVNASIDQAIQGHHSAQSRAEADEFRRDIVRHSADLDHLCQDHEATVDAKNEVFERQQRLEIENLCRRLIQAVGQDLFQMALRDLTKNLPDATSSTPTTASQPLPPATDLEPTVVSPTEHPARSPTASSDKPVHTDGDASSTRKRRMSAEPESHGRRKRTTSTRKTISHIWFDELYQQGHAETKHIIVEHPKGSDVWYIIRCQQCPRDFGDVPLRNAGAHLYSSQHGSQLKNAEHVVKEFGIQVLGCNKELADKNNAVARHAFRRQKKEGPPPPDNTTASGSRHGHRGGGGIVSPTPGQVYLGYWSKAKKSWPVLLLPTANLEDVGVPETINSLKLLENLPPCYRFGNARTQTLEWAEGFEDGGAKVAKRRFPVMFFDDSLEFPSESEVAWLAAKDLDVLDIESTSTSDVPHIQSVRAYLRARAQIPSEVDPRRQTDVHEDAISRQNDGTHQTPEGGPTDVSEPGILEPGATRVRAGLVPVAEEPREAVRSPVPETSIGAPGNSDDNPRRNSIDIISISSSTQASGSHEIRSDGAAFPSPNELNRTTSAPNADGQTTTSTNLSVNNPGQPNQAHTTTFEATLKPHHFVPNLPAESAQASESRADYLATIAQNGLKKKLELSDYIPAGTVQQVAPQCAQYTEDRTRKVVATYSEFSSQLSLGNPANASDTTTIPPRVEIDGNPPRVPNPNFQHQGPHAPQVENRSINSPVPSAHSQSQPRPNTSPAPHYPILRPKLVQEQSTAQAPDPGRAGQHMPPSRWGNQGTAPQAHGVPDYNKSWPASNGATDSQTPYQGAPPPHQPRNDWRSINGLHERPR